MRAGERIVNRISGASGEREKSFPSQFTNMELDKAPIIQGLSRRMVAESGSTLNLNRMKV
jgi:hypothetical protein